MRSGGNLSDWDKLVIARWQCIPNKYILCMGNKELQPYQVIEEIKKHSPIGQQIVNIERDFLQSLKKNPFLDLLSESE